MSRFVNLNRIILFLFSSFLFALPISTALMNIFLYLAFILVLIDKNFYISFKDSIRNPIVWYSIGLFTLAIFSLLWSASPIESSISGLNAYHKLLIPLFFGYLFLNRKNKLEILNPFIYSCLAISIYAISIYLKILEPFNYDGLFILKFSITGGFKSHIITNICMAISGFLFLQKYRHDKKIRNFIFGSIIFIYSLFINDGTTGQILSILLISLFLYFKFGHKSLYIIPIFFSSIISIGLNYENSINSAFSKFNKGVEEYNSSFEIDSSISHRFTIWENAIRIFLQKPLAGYGVGNTMYAHEVNSKILKRSYGGNIASNAHSQLLMTLIELGLIGLFIYFAVFIGLLKQAMRSEESILKELRLGILLFASASFLGTSIIIDSGEGHILITILMIFFLLTNHKS